MCRRVIIRYRMKKVSNVYLQAEAQRKSEYPKIRAAREKKDEEIVKRDKHRHNRKAGFYSSGAASGSYTVDSLLSNLSPSCR